MSTATQPAVQVGKTYEINHSRKGHFTGRVNSTGDGWASVEVTKGEAGAMLRENRAGKGEEITVRLSLATFKEVKAT